MLNGGYNRQIIPVSKDCTKKNYFFLRYRTSPEIIPAPARIPSKPGACVCVGDGVVTGGGTVVIVVAGVEGIGVVGGTVVEMVVGTVVGSVVGFVVRVVGLYSGFWS